MGLPPLEKNRGSNHKAGCVSKDKLAILCIEDNTDLAQLLQAIFEKLGHEAHLAYNGEDGLTKAKELLPNIIFCDVGGLRILQAMMWPNTSGAIQS